MMARLSLTAPELNDFDVIVFDLDDTLYSEKTYVASGYAAISLYIKKLFNIDFSSLIKENLDSNNVLKSALHSSGLPIELLPQLIQIYRYHWPEIKLLPNALVLLDELKKLNKPIYLITDGRSLTQRLKIDSLGIQAYFREIYISEEQGHEKPALHSFNKIMLKEPNKAIVYIADNPKKDFVAPQKLGWSSIGIKHEDIRVHPLLSVQEPQYWLHSIAELRVSS
jgi:putative hydrolase of the HAD superfamily